MVVFGALFVGGLLYWAQVKPALDFNPPTETETFVRNALDDAVPEVPYEKYLTAARMQRYYNGDGFELRLVTKSDPRKKYADTESKCGIEKAEKFDFDRPRREIATNALRENIKKCVDAFLAPIPRMIPVNALADVTEGTKPIESTWLKLVEDLAPRLQSPIHTFVLQVSKIFDGPYTVAKEWEISPRANQEQIKAILDQATSWVLAPKGATPNSSISFGLLNGFRLREEMDLRGGLVFVAGDGVEISRNLREPRALDFRLASSEKSYLAAVNWARFDSKILADNGGACTPLFGAKVHWYSPPSMDLTVRSTAKYWEHFLKEKCGAGSFVFHF